MVGWQTKDLVAHQNFTEPSFAVYTTFFNCFSIFDFSLVAIEIYENLLLAITYPIFQLEIWFWRLVSYFRCKGITSDNKMADIETMNITIFPINEQLFHLETCSWCLMICFWIKESLKDHLWCSNLCEASGIYKMTISNTGTMINLGGMNQH